MEEEQKSSVSTESPTPSLESVPAPADVLPAPEKSSPSLAMNPNEWFKSDNPEQSKPNRKLPPTRTLLITGAAVIGIIIAGFSFVLATKNTIEQDTSPTTGITSSSSEASSDKDAQTSPAEGVAPEEQATSQTPGGSTGGGSSSGSTNTSSQTGSTAQTHTLSFTFNGCYSPNNGDITIKAGDTIRFVNTDSKKDMWPASDSHPAHDDYGSNNEFDAGSAIAPGGSWSFTFTKKGAWDYHDHLKSSCGGTITVS
jgi:plastocyanin